MRKSLTQLFVSIALAASMLSVVPSASADDVKMVGVITKIKLAADGKSAQAILKDGKHGAFGLGRAGDQQATRCLGIGQDIAADGGQGGR